MATNYPAALDNSTTIPVESANTKLSVNHVTAHQNIQDAIEAIEAKVGIDGSADTDSLDYKLSDITGSDKAVPNVDGELTTPSLTLGSDATGDLFYRGSDGKVKRLGVGSNGKVLKVTSSLPAWETETVTNNGSTTVAGIYEEATQAEVEGRTAIGATGARLAITSSNITTVRTHDYAADASGTDAYAITITPVPTAYTTGDRFTFKAGTANTGSCTLNVNSLGAKTIKLGTSSLYTGQILANQIVEVVYDGADMQLVSLSPLSTNSTITEAVASGNTRTSNTATVQYGPSTPVAYTLMKEILYNDVGGTVNVVFTSTFDSGGGESTQYSRVYINGAAVGTERTTQNTFTESFTVETGDLIQIYGKIAFIYGTAIYSVRNMYLNYDKQLKQTFITNTNNS